MQGPGRTRVTRTVSGPCLASAGRRVGQTAAMEKMSSTPPGHADYRFLLANERTFLAYVRTALALEVAGFGILQFLTHSQDVVREGFGISMVAAGSFVGLIGYRRFRSNETTIRAGGDMRTAQSPVVLALAVGALPLVAALLVTFA